MRGWSRGSVVRLPFSHCDRSAGGRRDAQSDGGWCGGLPESLLVIVTATAGREAARRRSSTIAVCRALPRAEIESIIRKRYAQRNAPFGSLPEPTSGGDHLRAFVQRIAFDLGLGRPCRRESFSSERDSAGRVISRVGRGRTAGPDLSNIGRQMTVPELTRGFSSPTPRLHRDTRLPAFSEGTAAPSGVRSQRRKSCAAAADGRRPLVAGEGRSPSRRSRARGGRNAGSGGFTRRTRDLIRLLSRLDGEQVQWVRRCNGCGGCEGGGCTGGCIGCE